MRRAKCLEERKEWKAFLSSSDHAFVRMKKCNPSIFAKGKEPRNKKPSAGTHGTVQSATIIATHPNGLPAQCFEKGKTRRIS